jgi:hypothetical protein
VHHSVESSSETWLSGRKQPPAKRLGASPSLTGSNPVVSARRWLECRRRLAIRRPASQVGDGGPGWADRGTGCPALVQGVSPGGRLGCCCCGAPSWPSLVSQLTLSVHANGPNVRAPFRPDSPFRCSRRSICGRVGPEDDVRVLRLCSVYEAPPEAFARSVGFDREHPDPGCPLRAQHTFRCHFDRVENVSGHVAWACSSCPPFGRAQIRRLTRDNWLRTFVRTTRYVPHPSICPRCAQHLARVYLRAFVGGQAIVRPDELCSTCQVRLQEFARCHRREVA